MPLWSDPTQGGITPAQAMSRYEVRDQNISPLVAQILREREMQRQQMQQGAQDAIKGVAGAIQKSKNDQIAQQFLDQASNYDREYSADGENNTPNDYEMMARKLNESSASPSDSWAAFQQYQNNKIKNDLEQAHADYFKRFNDSDGQPPTPVADPSTGKVWDGSKWVNPVPSKTKDDPWANAIVTARGTYVDGKFKGDNNGDYVKIVSPSGYESVVPRDTYYGRVNKQPNGAQPAQQDQFVVGKKYKDAQGNEATYLGNGKWSQ